MKKLLLVTALIAVMLVGCIRAPNYPGMVQIQTNEIAFLVDMTSDAAVTGSNAEIQKKDIPIPGYFVRTGRFDHQGYWRPTLKVIAVSQAPVRREWDKTDATQSVRMVSRESSGFVVPMIINAYIADRASAVKYLSAFRPISDDNIDWSKIEQRNWAPYVKENAQPLERALDTVVYTKIMEQLSVLFVRTPILNAEVASKIYIPAVCDGMSAAVLSAAIRQALPDVNISFNQDVPSLKEWALETYGITITAMAPGDGVLYDSEDVQRQIDALAAAVMREKTLTQDRINAISEANVRAAEAEGQARVAQAQANTAQYRARLQEIENSKLIAEAQAEAIKIQAGKWNGQLPQTMVVQDLTALGSFYPGISGR